MAIVALTIWTLLIAFFMILSGTINLEFFFVLWLIGLIVAVELTSMKFSTPPSVQKNRYLVAIGIMLFGIIIAVKVKVILNL
ncbi:hypothetical protein [Methanosphaerula palustris]|uniref:Uncharacterized protein n=1 Tax=Methanosphaerula palustris (strain ATCC BAA-1556 / DSM 19958 / E1-9c) TaxID=521011 RepID=B8GGA9_METPE|nr:hypothetical protein [Methanosphaerula palustris]ACL16183.1 conserved hypothetical protein [Methanosphaerula palustris E1-9c]